MSTKTQTVLEMSGFVCAIAGMTALGWVIAGPILSAALGLLVASVVLIFLGNT